MCDVISLKNKLARRMDGCLRGYREVHLVSDSRKAVCCLIFRRSLPTQT